MTTSKYTKATFEKLKERVVEQVYLHGKENDSCEVGMIDFITEALSIPRPEAAKLLKEAKEKNSTHYILEIKFSLPTDDAEVYNHAVLSEFCDVFSNLDVDDTDEIEVDSIELRTVYPAKFN